jgi:hypothetical protein
MEAIDEEGFLFCRNGIFLARRFMWQFIIEDWRSQRANADTCAGLCRP